MSETEHHKGKLRLIKHGDLEETAKHILARWYGETLEDCYESYVEQLSETGYRDFVIFEDNIYKVDGEKVDPYDDVAVAFDNKDGTIDFEVRYYNGGCSFDEAVTSALRKVK